MKKTKVLLSLACAVMLVVTSVMGTMAYLTATDKVENTFTVGNVTLNNEYGHGLDEAKVGTDGKALTGDAAERVTGNSYKLMPGHEYTKDPIVHVASGSENCYLFVKVVNEISGIEDSTTTVASQMATNGWKAVDGQTDLYVYVGTAADASAPLAVAGGSNITVFEKIKIADTVDNTELQKYTNKTITVTAYAVQKDGFDGKTASEIWAATFGAETSTTTPET